MTPIILLKKKGPPFIADKPDNFEGLVSGSTIVVDKSPFISHVFEAMQSEPKRQIYLPLPPAMGKTCLLSMFKSFVDVSFHWRDDREDVFATKFDEGDTFSILKNENLCDEHFHKHPCLYISLKHVQAANVSEGIGIAIKRLFEDNCYLLQLMREKIANLTDDNAGSQSPKRSKLDTCTMKHDMKKFEKYCERECTSDIWTQDAIEDLISMIQKYSNFDCEDDRANKKVIILVDDFDAAIVNFVPAGWREDGVFRSAVYFLDRFLKHLSSQRHSRVLVTGTYAFFGEGYQLHYHVASAKEDSECKFFGFHEREFESLLNCFQFPEEKKRLVRENLNALDAGDHKLYNMLQVREILTETLDKKNDAEDADPKSQYKDIPSKSTGRFDSDLFQCRTVAEAISILRAKRMEPYNNNDWVRSIIARSPSRFPQADHAQISKCTNSVYLSYGATAENLERLKQSGISHIVNLATGIGCLFPDHFSYHRINADDTESQDIKQHFDGALNFMRNAIDNGGTVLVHCNAGVSRSATIVIAYIMKYERKTFKDSFLQVENARRVIAPNFAFIEQLLEFERELGL